MTTFTRRATTYDTATDTQTVATTTLTGSAIRVRASSGEIARFSALGVHQETAVLFFTPTTYGDRPRPGDTVAWETDENDDDIIWTVAFVDPIAPDGVTIAARVGVRR